MLKSCSDEAEVAQLVEHPPEERGVDSSSLSLGTTVNERSECYSGANLPKWNEGMVGTSTLNIDSL